MWVITTVLGVALVLLALGDALATTINVTERAGPMARTVLHLSRSPLRAVLRGPRRAIVGLVQTVLMLATWTGALWLGWWLVMLGDPVVLIRGEDGVAAGMIDHLYVAGYSVFTLGAGDFVPASTAAQLSTVLAAGTGLVLVTLEVTYLLGLTGASQHKRRVARILHGLGGDVPTVVRRAFDGRGFSAAEQLLDSLANDLAELAEHHVAFPVLHELAASRRELAAGPALLRLHDAVHLMHACTAEEARLPELPVVMTRAAVDELLTSMPELDLAGEPPPTPDTRVLKELGVPLAPSTGHATLTEADHERRRGLHALAVHEGWADDGSAS